ncbi:MAG: hypothetical protein MUE33_10760 [Cytophagaceae bacterium]|jgi:hypothetical protein|nr:hypothetical protein [Cytophagaceae bacterium]
MSSSLDDMPAYEHFQDYLDSLLDKDTSFTSSERVVLHRWIEFITFSYGIANRKGIQPDILQLYFTQYPNDEMLVTRFLHQIQ